MSHATGAPWTEIATSLSGFTHTVWHQSPCGAAQYTLGPITKHQQRMVVENESMAVGGNRQILLPSAVHLEERLTVSQSVP